MVAQNKRLIAIGDIHGCYNTLVDLLKKVNYTSVTDTLIFVGDYIDRGPFSYEVVSTLKHLQAQVGKDRCICLRGNHEQFAIDSYGEPEYWWMLNGGSTTIGSYSRNHHEVSEHLPWFRSLPLVYQTDKHIFCHAGLTHPNLASNSQEDLLWGRAWLKADTRPREKCVFFGHTPMQAPPYFAATGDIGIDGGCVFGGSLCAVIIPEIGDYTFVTVEKSTKDIGLREDGDV